MSKNKINHDDYEIVYSNDPSILKKDNKSKTEIEILPSQTTIKMRIEKNQRAGKTVTVLFDLPNKESYFKELTKKIKNDCGSGGSFKNNQIEIQGDHKEKITLFLKKLGFKVK